MDLHDYFWNETEDMNFRNEVEQVDRSQFMKGLSGTLRIMKVHLQHCFSKCDPGTPANLKS